jgi:hypothetical protein
MTVQRHAMRMHPNPDQSDPQTLHLAYLETLLYSSTTEANLSSIACCIASYYFIPLASITSNITQ